MLDILLEIIRSLILLGIIISLLLAGQSVEHGRRGWLCIKLGFVLILFGSLIDITDNFPSMNWTIVIGDTPLQALLKNLFGYMGGYSLLAVGLWLWLPSIQELDRWHREYAQKTIPPVTEEGRAATGTEEERQQERIEQALLHAEERRMLLYENAPVGIAHGLIGGRYIERNDEFARMLGYTSHGELEKAIVASGDFSFIWHDKAEAEHTFALLNTKKRISGLEATFNHRDGSYVRVLLDFTTLADRAGVNYYFFCFARDITKQKQAEQARAESEQRLITIMNSMPAGIYLVDKEKQHIVDVNPAALNMTGYTREELIGEHCCDKLCPKEKGMCPAAEATDTLVNREARLKRKNGSDLYVIKTVANVIVQDHEYLLETFVDISEQKRLEQLKEDVDRIVQHDLKSPIIGLINASTVALMDESVVGEQREMLETIKYQGTKVLNMIGMSLIIYKMEAGTFEYTPESMDLMTALREVIADMAEPCRISQVTVSSTLNGAPLSDASQAAIMGNPLLVQSLMANLLRNAVEASRPGQSAVVTITTDNDVTITFNNKGVVPLDVRKKFFAKYATSGKPSGTGLGTYSAKLITTTMGGSIAMETSDERDSTTVTVHLPANPT